MKKYKADLMMTRIEEIEISKESEYMVWTGNIRLHKNSGGIAIRDTLEEAEEALLRYYKKRISEELSRVEYQERHLNKAKKICVTEIKDHYITFTETLANKLVNNLSNILETELHFPKTIIKDRLINIITDTLNEKENIE